MSRATYTGHSPLHIPATLAKYSEGTELYIREVKKAGREEIPIFKYFLSLYC
jgi:hypothetical protein